MTIGDRIRIRREKLNMSQEKLAFKLGYKSRSSINKIELGERELPQSKIKAIADALNTTPAYIMGWVGDNSGKKPQNMDEQNIFGGISSRNLKIALFEDAEIDDDILEEVKELAKLQLELRKKREQK